MPNKKYVVGDVVDLDDVAISPRAYQSWQATAAVGAQALVAAGLITDPSQIPDEQGLWLASGELEIFVEVGAIRISITRISMKIPPSEWQWM